MKFTKRPLRVLDFDIENRPLSYWQPDRPTSEITAIAWAEKPSEVYVVTLGRVDPVAMLESFVEAYNASDVVTGHYVRVHDLPIINGALIEYGLPPLKPKMVQDTKQDMIRKADIPATQEHLADMLGIKAHKYHMTQAMWREANRLTEKGMDQTEKRVTDDVKQHMQLRKAMLKAGWLKPPRMWYP